MNLDRAGCLAGAAVEVALERRVEQHRRDIPDDHKPGQDDQHGDDLVDGAGHRAAPSILIAVPGMQAVAHAVGDSEEFRRSRGCGAGAPSAASIRSHR